MRPILIAFLAAASIAQETAPPKQIAAPKQAPPPPILLNGEEQAQLAYLHSQIQLMQSQEEILRLRICARAGETACGALSQDGRQLQRLPKP